MTEAEILSMWKKGIDKYKVAESYFRRYNQQVKLVRLNPKGRKMPFITRRQALAIVERTIYKYIMEH